MSSEFPIQMMTQECLPDCQKLREQIGWNQVLTDWQRFYTLNPSGCYVVKDQNKIVGTVCTVKYEHSGWVAMVIVDQAYRRLGIGKKLLMAGIEHLEQHGLTVWLDATPEGKLLYDTIGFHDEYHEARFECDGYDRVPLVNSHCQPLRLDDLNALDEFDRPIFGESRKHVLRSYLHYYPDHGYCIRKNGKIRGYICARDGWRAFHIGPWVALNSDDANTLFCHCIHQRKPERVYVDILEPNAHVWDLLQDYGFTQQRPFIRMYRGKQPNPGMPKYVYGLSGPELG